MLVNDNYNFLNILKNKKNKKIKERKKIKEKKLKINHVTKSHFNLTSNFVMVIVSNIHIFEIAITTNDFGHLVACHIHVCKIVGYQVN